MNPYNSNFLISRENLNVFLTLLINTWHIEFISSYRGDKKPITI